MQRLNLFFHISLCCITIAQAEREQTLTSQKQQSRQLQIKHLPPPPVTPFRGGLSAVRNNNDGSGRNDNINSNGDDASVEASSSDYYYNNNYHSTTSSSMNHAHRVKSFPPSWTPEDFPDPWTNPLLCGGAATASQLNQPQGNVDAMFTPQKMKRPLFCDPDQVLDKSTLRTVMIKLREFSQEFASKNFVEGGDFGFWDVDGDGDEEEQQQQQQNRDGENSSEDEQNNDNDNDEDAPDQTAHNLRRRLRLRRGNTPTNNKDPILINKRRHLSSSNNNNGFSDTDTVEVAIALVQRINLPAILRADSYFFYSDQDDMVNDAAQYFARYVHDTWNKRLIQEQKGGNASTNIVLIFISVHDRICYISSGTRIATILPWWRLEHVVQDMKPMLRTGHTGNALEIAIDDMTTLLRAGSPTVKDRISDFFSRFGVVLAFAFFTFLFATYGEFQDRRKRVFLAERKSRLNAAEREKARSLQKEFQSKVCPICLEPFGSSSSCSSSDKDEVDDTADGDTSSSAMGCVPKKGQEQKMKRVDSLGIPLKGNDEKPVKLLRCGHIFDETCWKMWVDSGHGNTMMCPVCRQDVGRVKRGSRHHDAIGGTATSTSNDGNNSAGQQQSLFLRIMEHANAATAPATLLRPINNLHTNYSSTLRSSTLTGPDYEERFNDSSATSLYSTETTSLI